MRFTSFVSSVGLIAFAAGTMLAQNTTLTIDRSSGPARVGLSGETGRDYVLEAATDSPAPGAWSPLLSLTLTNGSLNWWDADSLAMPQRFYRAVKLDGPAPVEIAPDFRLLDHQGRSRELYYYWNDPTKQAFVLIFTGKGCSNVTSSMPAIRALTNRFGSQGVVFWMIDSNAGDTRSNLAVQATALGINFPILQDSAQIVARAFGATKNPEAIAIARGDWSIFYRGVIEDNPGGNPQRYLSNALVNFLASRPVSPSRAPSRGCDITLNPQTPVSYSADIAPMLKAHCVRCHSPANLAPFAMSNYNIVSLAAPFIKDEVMAGRMPPWHADPDYGVFTNDFSLRPDEKAKLIQWIDAGAPRGEGDDVLEATFTPTNYPYAWPASLGQPDKVLRIPLQTLPANGEHPNRAIDYRYLTVSNTFGTDVWLRAAIVRPANLKSVHHCLVYFGNNSQFEGMDGFFAGYVPGYTPDVYPAGAGKLLPKGTQLTFQMHYIATGQDETDQTELGLYLMPVPPTYAYQSKSSYNATFSIPPGNPDYQTTTTNGFIVLLSYTFTKAAYLYEMSPHMHLRGSRFLYEAVYPNGTRETLLSVPRYQFHWQTLYRFTQPKLMPVGAKIVCTAAWDNSPQNLDNPNPTVSVSFGQQTFEEMFIGFFNFAELR